MNEISKNFLSQNMFIDVNWVEQEFNSHLLVTSKKELELFVSELVCATSCDNPEKKILELFNAKTPLCQETNNYEIFDSLRHAFNAFVVGGLHELYIYQSNESWYPRIRLQSELKPNDISILPSTIEIYRGCDVSELSKKQYGQSWSTSIDVAKEFAFIHYASQPWFKKEKRCILNAKIDKNDVLFSRQSHHEREVAVQVNRLKNITRHLKQGLT